MPQTVQTPMNLRGTVHTSRQNHSTVTPFDIEVSFEIKDKDSLLQGTSLHCGQDLQRKWLMWCRQLLVKNKLSIVMLLV